LRDAAVSSKLREPRLPQIWGNLIRISIFSIKV
jgi:hypothetical protein